MGLESRICRKCSQSKPLGSFVEVRPGVTRATCTTCRKSTDLERNPERVRLERQQMHQRAKERRAAGLDVGQWILEDSRRSDRKLGRTNDLTRDFIYTLISKGCQYCGETKLRMTLDRLDNSQGHLQSNVQPSCIRCNLTRGSMPYEAWLLLVGGMKKAHPPPGASNPSYNLLSHLRVSSNCGQCTGLKSQTTRFDPEGTHHHDE